MPTSTFLSYDLVNVGPLTTTFTAPSSCETASNLALAEKAFPYVPVGSESCVPYSSQGTCVPSGSEIDAISKTKGMVLIGGYGWAMPYFSPGYHCPAGYTTAGVAEKSANGESSVTGIFSMTAIEAYPEESPQPTPFQLPGVNVVASALDEGETAVICCKSGYHHDPIYGCYSNPPATLYTASNGCEQFPDTIYWVKDIEFNTSFTYNGQVITKGSWSDDGYPSSWIWSTMSMTLGDDEGAAWQDRLTGYTMVEMVTLIHRGAQDGAPTGPSGNDATTQTGSAEEASSTGDKGSEASASASRMAFLLLSGLAVSTLAGSLWW